MKIDTEIIKEVLIGYLRADYIEMKRVSINDAVKEMTKRQSNLPPSEEKKEIKPPIEGERERGISMGYIGINNEDHFDILAARGILPKDKVILIAGDSHLTGTSYPELKPSDPFPIKMPIIVEPKWIEIKDGQTSRRERRAKERKKSNQ